MSHEELLSFVEAQAQKAEREAREMLRRAKVMRDAAKALQGADPSGPAATLAREFGYADKLRRLAESLPRCPFCGLLS